MRVARSFDAIFRTIASLGDKVWFFRIKLRRPPDAYFGSLTERPYCGRKEDCPVSISRRGARNRARTDAASFWICCTLFFVVPLFGSAATPAINAGYGGLSSTSLFLNSDGSVWGTGKVFTYTPGATSPVRAFQLSNVIAVANSGGTQFALLADGTLWGVGANGYGDLANGTTVGTNQPLPIAGLSGVKAFSASGYSHYLALLGNGTVWAWGRNDHGQLGDGTRTDRHVPVQVIGLTDVKRISAGFSTALALRSDGTVWIWGFTANGAAGDGLDTNSAGADWNRLIPTQIRSLDRVTAIAAGANHNMALREDGTVWSWGQGDLGQNGTGAAGLSRHQLLPIQVPGLDGVIAIDTNATHAAFALKSDGTVWAWGNNGAGQLGMGAITYSAVPIPVPGLSNIIAISAGYDHILAMRGDGTVLAWGSNGNGQLGDGSLQGRAEPRVVQGPGGTGQLNLVQAAPSSFNQLPRVQISANVSLGAAPLTVNLSTRNATDVDGFIKAYSWLSGDGQQASGPTARFIYHQAGTYQIDLLVEDSSGGIGHVTQQITVTPSISAPVAVNAKIGLGNSSSIALTSDGRVLTWGASWMLGLYSNSLLPSGTPPNANSIPVVNGIIGAIDIALMSSQQAHVLLADGTVLGWGANDSGQIGTGSTVSQVFTPQVVTGLPPVQAVAEGNTHTLALTRDGRVFAWGRNIDGQLGVGDNQNRNAPVEIPGSSNVTAIAAGSDFSMALLGDGSVWVWGGSCCYQPGVNALVSSNRPIQVPELNNVQKIFAAPLNRFAIGVDGAVWASGTLPFPFTGYAKSPSTFSHVPALDGAVQIAGGGQHLVSRTADGKVWVVGKRSSMALGITGTGNIDVPQQVPGISDAVWVAASLDGRSMVLRSDGTVLAWGANTYGGLGDGTLSFEQTPVLVVNETATGFLDLIPELPNRIPQDKIPPFLLATYATGGLNSKTLYADFRGIIPSGLFASTTGNGTFAAGYNVYVAANVPSITGSPYFQMDANNNWAPLALPMTEFLRSVALDSQANLVRAQVLQNADLSSPQLVGASIIVGYGTDTEEMLRNARYRTIFTVPTE